MTDRMTEKEMRKILGQKIELSALAEERVQETYRMIRQAAEGAQRENGAGARRTGSKVTNGDFSSGTGSKVMNGDFTRRAADRAAGRGRKKWFFSPAAVAACMVFAITAAASAYLVSQTDFVDSIFGTKNRESIQVHTETVEGNSDTVEVTYPAREYVETDEALAQELLQGAVAAPQITRQIGDSDYTLTLQYVITDGISANLSFMLECESGITAIEWDELSNESKGAAFTDDCDFMFYVTDENDGYIFNAMMYVDMEHSTDTCLYFTMFSEMTEPRELEPSTWNLHLEQWEKTNGESLEDYLATGDATNPVIWEEDIPFEIRPASLNRYASEDGTLLFLYSPMSAAFVFSDILPEEEIYQYYFGTADAESDSQTDEAPESQAETTQEVETEIMDDWDPGRSVEPGMIEYLALEYQDGTTYVIKDSEIPIDNTNYICGGIGSENEYTVYLFNRLVDWSQVAKVIVNDTVVEFAE